MEKTYQPEQIEQRWYQSWEKSDYFAPSFEGKPYCIMLPPPNVTGTLHMGHGFQISLMDALIRYHRMMGFNTHWQVGTDHAGISTQMVVELQIAKEGLTRHSLGREAFIRRVWDWKDQSDSTIKQQLRRMGASVDWKQERFSLDEGLTEAVKQVFVTLYEEGLIYKGQRLVNWDPVLHTAISDLEVIPHEETGSLWYIRYPLEDNSGHLVVATTRPETLLGDVAVAVNPEDERYQHLVGKNLILPLVNRKIPIIADDSVAKDFGTGCVKITPAHDFNDYAMGERHELSRINIFTIDAKINEQAPPAYQGLDRFEARKRIVADLADLDLLEQITPHQLSVPRGEKSGAVIEPYLTTQWFIRAKPLATPAIEAVKNDLIKFVPETWEKIYFQWLDNIQDWCISRQLWWGHRIPAWYDEEGNIYVGKDEEDARCRNNVAPSVTLKQDDDVLDTWFSAALWPFATLGWPEETQELRTFYPTSVLVTGFDIIFFWVARMIMMGLKFKGQIPFETVYITGLIRDSEGQKMSKSKGNTLDPIDLIDGISLEQLLKKRTQNLLHPKDAARITKMTTTEFPDGIPAYGTDSLRFTYYALASTGRDVRFDLGRIEGYRNFCNKLWNAARFVLMNTETHTIQAGSPRVYSLADRWIRSQLQHTIQKVHHYFQSYRFDLLAHTIYEFIWNEYCDWYLELSKPILYATEENTYKESTRFTLIDILETLLRLTHPLMPFITEEIWQRVAGVIEKAGNTIMLEQYPLYDQPAVDLEAEQNIELLKNIVIAIRNIRGEMNVAPNRTISLIFSKGNTAMKDRINELSIYIKTLAKVDKISWTTEIPVAVATALVEDLELFIPMADLIDKQAEVTRLAKEIHKLEADLAKCKIKLNNPSYVSKAPPHVVEQEKSRAEEIETAINKLQARLIMIDNIEDKVTE
ncbi:MAG: valine--tRNA ligase [Gammaproteobacteria bacterium]|nr:valine--tRNA ligase [Gammaproteobacteria bacterium]